MAAVAVDAVAGQRASVMVARGVVGSVDQRRSWVLTWACCNWRVREAHMRSRGLCRFHMLKSATCGPSSVTMRNTWPAGTFQAKPLRIGTTCDSTSWRCAGSAIRNGLVHGMEPLLT